MLEVQNLMVQFNRFRAVDNISFSVTPDSGITALLGPNGAGKTTTMRAITGYLQPSAGQVTVAGILRTDPESEISIKKKIGYLPETTPLFNEMLVSEFLEFAGRSRGLSNNDLESSARYMIERLELGSHFYTPLGLLSKGYRQRVALAATLLHNPEVIILDEPTSGLDPNQIQSIRSLIKEFRGKRTVILSTHILQEVDDVCDRAIIVHRGKVVADRSVVELKDSNRFRLTARDANNSDLTDRLKSIEGVTDVKRFIDESGWHHYNCAIQVAAEAFFSKVRNEPIEIREFTQISRSLDEIFRELTIK